MISERVRRGMRSNAVKGRPHGAVPYGYRREFHPETRQFVRQVPDDTVRRATGVDGAASEYTRAGIVADLVARVAAGAALSRLARELNDRGVPTPTGVTWAPSKIRQMVMSPAYIGTRTHKGEVTGERCWPALVEEEKFWAATRVLSDPARKTTRGGRAVWLSSYLVRCYSCGGPLAKSGAGTRGRPPVYSCLARGCSAVLVERLDSYITAAVVGWLAREDVADLIGARAADADVAAARVEAERLRAELEQWRQLAENGEVSPVSFARAEQGLLGKLGSAEERAHVAGLPPVLRGRVGPEAATVWDGLGLEVKREIIRTVADIRLRPAGKARDVPLTDRLVWTWKLTDPDAVARTGGATARG